MSEQSRIPVVVGVTGHLNLRDGDTETLRAAVKRELGALRDRNPHTEIKLLCSLAAGADLLCAETAEEMGIPLIAALPRGRESYEEDFSPADLQRLKRQLDRAESVFTVVPMEAVPEEVTRDFGYRQAGIYVAEHCHILLALWDGEEDRSGCGTAATVSFALAGDWLPTRGEVTRTGDNTGVIHILAPRQGTEGGTAGKTTYLGNRPLIDEILRKTEEFNALAAECPDAGSGLLPEGSKKDAALERMESLYGAADSLSGRYAKVYRRTIALLALAGTLLTLFFLIYDEGEMQAMVLLCGVTLLLAAWARRMAERSQCHRRYIEYRALAEALRTQVYLRYAGSRMEVQRLMTWSQQRETGWVLCAVSGLNTAEPPGKAREIRDCWVEPQRRYHEAGGRKAGKRKASSERVVSCATWLSAVFYIAALLYELIWGGLIFRPAGGIGSLETGRTLLKVLLGTISAGTLFISSYYGKMSLGRKTEDHEKLERFYARAEERLEQWGQSEILLEQLAREELTENGNWCSYQKDNTPEINA